MSPLPIGALRRRVTLESQTRTPDGGGGVTITWTPVTDLWAEIRDGGGNEYGFADAVQGKITHIVTLRRRADVVPAMRLRQGARVFVILAVLDRDGPGAVMRILAEEQNL